MQSLLSLWKANEDVRGPGTKYKCIKVLKIIYISETATTCISKNEILTESYPSAYNSL